MRLLFGSRGGLKPSALCRIDRSWSVLEMVSDCRIHRALSSAGHGLICVADGEVYGKHSCHIASPSSRCANG
jgi:hypothetical protein